MTLVIWANVQIGQDGHGGVIVTLNAGLENKRGPVNVLGSVSVLLIMMIHLSRVNVTLKNAPIGLSGMITAVALSLAALESVSEIVNA